MVWHMIIFFDEFDSTEAEKEKLDTTFDLIVTKKSLSNNKNKAVYNKMINFYTLKRDVVHDYADSLNVYLSDSDSDSDQKGSGIKV